MRALKSYGASGLNIEVGSLYSAIIGGITVVTTVKMMKKLKMIYKLYTLQKMI